TREPSDCEPYNFQPVDPRVRGDDEAFQRFPDNLEIVIPNTPNVVIPNTLNVVIPNPTVVIPNKVRDLPSSPNPQHTHHLTQPTPPRIHPAAGEGAPHDHVPDHRRRDRAADLPHRAQAQPLPVAADRRHPDGPGA